MERLTNHFSYCECAECKYYDEELAKCNKCKIFITSTGHCHDKKVWEKLREYEDLEEQGLLLKLPCKVGDTVYSITRDFISEYNIRNFICYDNGNIFFDWKCVKGIYLNIKGFHIDDIGKTVFLTKEEAEKALERLEKDNE